MNTPEFAEARKELEKIVAFERDVEKDLETAVMKIQAIHQEQGDEATKCVGKVDITLKEIKGKFSNENSQYSIKISMLPEDACVFPEGDDGTYSFEWDNSDSFPCNISYEKVMSREASICVEVSQLSNEVESTLHSIKIPVATLFEKEMEQWHQAIPDVYDISSTAEESQETTLEEDEEKREELPEILIWANLTFSEVEALAQEILSLSKKKQALEQQRKIAGSRLNLAKRSQATAQEGYSKKTLKMEPKVVQPRNSKCIFAQIQNWFNPVRLETLKNVTMFLGATLLFHLDGESFAV